MSPGPVALLGSGEFLPWTEPVDRTLLDAATGGDRVLIVPTASAPEGDAVFGSWGDRGVEHYSSLGVPAEVVPLRTREDADRSELVSALDRASLVFLSGGNPAYLASTLRDTAWWAALLERFTSGTAIAGCSAGAAALPERAPDTAVSGLGPELWRPGLGFADAAVIGPHWDALDGYVPGMTAAITGTIALGERLVAIDEETAIVGDGETWTVQGRGGVHVFEQARWRSFAAGRRLRLALIPASG
ncbi:MAG: Type 1 glutamine amidotransferase-like domain-containing protein [Actinomycetota bacterium]